MKTREQGNESGTSVVSSNITTIPLSTLSKLPAHIGFIHSPFTAYDCCQQQHNGLIAHRNETESLNPMRRC
jgi:hypothetical protein